MQKELTAGIRGTGMCDKPLRTRPVYYLQVPATHVSVALITVARVPLPFPTVARHRQVHNASTSL